MECGHCGAPYNHYLGKYPCDCIKRDIYRTEALEKIANNNDELTRLRKENEGLEKELDVYRKMGTAFDGCAVSINNFVTCIIDTQAENAKLKDALHVAINGLEKIGLRTATTQTEKIAILGLLSELREHMGKDDA